MKTKVKALIGASALAVTLVGVYAYTSEAEQPVSVSNDTTLSGYMSKQDIEVIRASKPSERSYELYAANAPINQPADDFSLVGTIQNATKAYNESLNDHVDYPDTVGLWIEPDTYHLKSTYSPSQLLTLVRHGEISLVCQNVYNNASIVVNPLFVYYYSGGTNEWTYWDDQILASNGLLFASHDQHCELYDRFYGDINVQLQVDSINDQR